MFSIEGKFFGTISRLGDLVILNILFLVCSIPIVTIGAYEISSAFFNVFLMVFSNVHCNVSEYKTIKIIKKNANSKNPLPKVCKDPAFIRLLTQYSVSGVQYTDCHNWGIDYSDVFCYKEDGGGEGRIYR